MTDRWSDGTSTTLALVRHGETAWNRDGRIQGHSNIGLTSAGRDEIAQLAQTLQGSAWAGIVTSPLRRARESAAILSAALGCGIEVDERLTERDYGPAEGLSVGEAKRRFPLGDNVPGREPSHEVAQRGAEAIRAAANPRRWRRAIIVSHGALLSEALRCLEIPVGWIATGTAVLIGYDGSRFEHLPT